MPPPDPIPDPPTPPNFGPPAFLLVKLPSGTFVVCQSIVAFTELGGNAQLQVDTLFEEHGIDVEMCKILPPFNGEGEGGAFDMQAFMQAASGD